MLSVFDQGPQPSCPTPFNMAQYVLSNADRLASKPALVMAGSGRVMTFGELRNTVQSVAGGLIETGLTPGERILFRLGNSPDFPIAYLACIWAGLIPVPLSAQLTRAEVDTIAKRVKPAAIFAAEGISIPTHPDAHVLTRIPEGRALPADLGDPNRLAYIIFTSGTSGVPRGVCHAHRAIWARRMMHDGWYRLSESDRVMHAGAFNWTYTLGTGLMDPWSLGATAVIPEPGTQPSELMELAREHEVTLFAAAPGVFRQVLRSEVSVPTLRHGLSAGEHLSDSLRQTWRLKTGTDLHQAFGMSECSTFVSSSPGKPAPVDSSGYPQNGRKVAILNNGEPAPIGTPGMIAISHDDPGLFLSYLDDDGLKGDWFETGDVARMSEDGSITYLGRADDMMNAGGFRVSPLEVERCFNAVKGITACAAIEFRVKQDTSVIALIHQGSVSEQQLRAHAEEELARYKQPRLYFAIEALPYGGNGKLNRRALRDRYEANHGWTD